jgi:heptosyltransferase-1
MYRNILIIRLSAIGDIVMASPLIGAFRRTMPGARLTWLVEEPSRSLLEANPELDEILVWPRQRWRGLLRSGRIWSLLREVHRFVKELRKRKFDLAVDAQGLMKSGLWAWLSGAPERVGVGSREGSQHLMTRVVRREGTSDRISSHYLVLAEALDLDTGDFRMDLSLPGEALEYANHFSTGLGRDYVVLCPHTTRPQKHWLEDRWIEVMDHITGKMGLAAVILGGQNDRGASERIMREESAHMVNLTGKTGLTEAAAVLGNAALVIGVDTGLTHMGFALGVPTIALFGATRPYLDTEGTPGRVLYHPRECSPCRRSPTCDDRFPCMGAITTDEVVVTMRGLLNTP